MKRALFFTFLVISTLILGVNPVDVANEYLNFIIKGDFEKAYDMQADAMKAQLPSEKIKIVWDTITQNYGDFVSIQGTKLFEVKGYIVVVFTLKFEKIDLDARVTVDKEGKIAGLFFTPSKGFVYEPPDYVDKSAFSEEEISFKTDFEIKGTLTRPIGNGPFPAVVLVHGSGPNDRDETIGPNKVFRDIAWGLATRGILVLRYDKRTYLYGNKMGKDITVEDEVIEDAVKAVSILKERSDVSKVFVLGHSLGAMLAPEIAKRSKADGVIMLAPGARSLVDLIEDQIRYLSSIDFIEDPESILKSVEKLRKHEAKPDEIIAGAPASYYYDFEKRNVLETGKELNIPMFILQGGKDYQVTHKDFSIWKNTLEGKKNVKFKFYDDLNHLFMRVEGAPTPLDYFKPGHVDRKIIEDITDWIFQH
ncbi:MAG: alpha/beta fold hydrolase [Thermotogaceae bacterium]|nr:alpha/beta fold hydrolase [Thermotogaceae bacterium]